MLVDKVAAMLHLLAVELDAELEVLDSPLLLGSDRDRQAYLVVDALPRKEGGTYKQSWQNIGPSSLTFFIARSLIIWKSKSTAKPGIIFSSGNSLVAAVKLGGE